MTIGLVIICFSSTEHNMLMVSYCDGPVSHFLCRPSCVVNNNQHLLLNHMANCKQTTEMFLRCYPVKVVQKIKFHFKLFLSESTRPKADIFSEHLIKIVKIIAPVQGQYWWHAPEVT